MKLKNSYQDSFETGNQIKSLFDPVESQINGLKIVLKEVVVIVCKENASKQKYSENLFPKPNLVKITKLVCLSQKDHCSLIKFANRITVSERARK
jgi:hypothetical protein